MTEFNAFLTTLRTYDVRLFNLGQSQINVSTLIGVALGIVLLFVLAGWLRRWLINRLLAHTSLDEGAREAVATLVRYVVIVVGFMFVMQSAGIDLTTFNVLAGAVGVGIGFGLQNIVSNFISGLIVMLERPVRIGDRIEVAGSEGDVIEIGARSTKLLTARRVVAIVPNQKIITETVRNWEYGSSATALTVTAKAASAHDAHDVERLLIDATRDVDGLLTDPPPQVLFTAMDGNGHTFELQAWTNADTNTRAKQSSALHFAVHNRFKAAGVKLAA
ncbi:MAG TPA: mechanosensitive ion channel domain-containing protein [Burkholderiaceae bacterium]|nr:mechanosensitive ion channel domain-containing protein [Burkholderiaceae bacterium]